MAENLDFSLMQKARFDAFANTHRRSHEATDRREDYNHVRPHSRLGNLTPSEFAAAAHERALTCPVEGQIEHALASIFNSNYTFQRLGSAVV